MKNKIYIISPFESVVEKRGTRNIELSKILLECGYDVVFVTSNFSHQEKKNYDIEYMESLLNKEPYNYKIINTIEYKKHLSFRRVLSHIIVSRNIFKYMKLNVIDGDIVIVSSIPPELGYYLSRLKNIRSVKLILDVRDIWPDAFPSKDSIIFSLFSKYCNYFISNSLTHYDRFVYVAKSFKGWIEKYNSNRKDIDDISSFIPLGYDSERWTNNFAGKIDKIKLVYIGYLAYQFDIENIIKAVNNVPNIEFYVVGDGERLDYYESLSTTVRVKFLGRQPFKDAARVINSCHVGILPIRLGSTAQMPNKLFDYLGASLPILSLGNNDSSTFISINQVGWVCDDNYDEVKMTLQKINCDSLVVARKNLNAIRKEYSKESLYADYVKIIEGVKSG